MKDVKETLEAARDILSDPANWKQGGLAEVDRAKNEVVGPYCSLGAIGKVCEIFAIRAGGSSSRTGEIGGGFHIIAEANNDNSEARDVYMCASKVLSECYDQPVHEYNDSHDHECVLAAFDAAIERLEAEA